MNGPQPAVAVDCTKEYAEIDLGMLKLGRRVLELPGKSDWAVAVGRFSKLTLR